MSLCIIIYLFFRLECGMSISKDIQSFLKKLKSSPREATVLLKGFTAEHFSYDIAQHLKETTPKTLFQFLLLHENRELARYALAKMHVKDIREQYDAILEQNRGLRKPLILGLQEAERILLESEEQVMKACRLTPFSGVDLSSPFFTKYYDNNEELETYIRRAQEIHESLSNSELIAPNNENSLVSCLEEIQKLSPADRSLQNIITPLYESDKTPLALLQLNLIKITDIHADNALVGHDNEKIWLAYYKFCLYTLYLRAEYALCGSLGGHMAPYLRSSSTLYALIKNNLADLPAHLLRFLVDYFYLNMRYYSQHPKQSSVDKHQNLFRLCQETFLVCGAVSDPLSKIALLQIAVALYDTTAVSDPEAPIIYGESITPVAEQKLLTVQTQLKDSEEYILVAYLDAFLLKYKLEVFCRSMRETPASKTRRQTTWERNHSFIERAENIFAQHLPVLAEIALSRPDFFDSGNLYHDNITNPRYAALCLLDMLEQTAMELLATLEEEAKPFEKQLNAIHDIVRLFAKKLEGNQQRAVLNLPELDKLQWRKHQTYVSKANRCYKLFIHCSKLRNLLAEQHFFDVKRPALRAEEIRKTENISKNILRWSGSYQIMRSVLTFAAEHNAFTLEPPTPKPLASSHREKKPHKASVTSKTKPLSEEDRKVPKIEEPEPEQLIKLYALPQHDKRMLYRLCAQNQFLEARRYLEKLYPINQSSFEDLQKTLYLRDFWAHCQHKYGTLPHLTKDAYLVCYNLQQEMICRFPDLAQRIGLSNYTEYQELLVYYETLAQEEQHASERLTPIPIKTILPAGIQTRNHPASVGATSAPTPAKPKVLPGPEDIHIKRKKIDWTESSSVCSEAREIFTKLEDAKLDFLIRGGWVRDMYRQKTPKDIDIVVFASKDSLQSLFGMAFSLTSSRLNLGQIKLKNAEPIDILYETAPSSKAEWDTRLKSHYQSVDVTINSLLYDWVKKTLIYEQSTLEDIEKNQLKLPKHCNPKLHFKDDPIRMWRVLYFMIKLKFKPDESLQKSILDCRLMLNDVNEDRRFIEFKKLCSQGYVDALTLLLFYRFNEIACLSPLDETLINELKMLSDLQKHLAESPDAFMAILHAKTWTEQYTDPNENLKDFTRKFLGEVGIFKNPKSQCIYQYPLGVIWYAFSRSANPDLPVSMLGSTLQAEPTSSPDLSWVLTVSEKLGIKKTSVAKNIAYTRFFQPQQAKQEARGRSSHHQPTVQSL